MKSEKIWRNSLTLAGLLLIGAGWPGCTATPAPVAARIISFDGLDQNGGFIGFDAAGNGIITAHARDRYNALVAIYGDRFHPGVKPGDGIGEAGKNFTIDPEHLVKFQQMNRWLRSVPKP